MIITWILVIIAVEAVTEILVDSELFFSIRNLLTKINPGFLGKLWNCGYCMSVWVSASCAWMLPGQLISIEYVDIAIKIFVVHRMSNLFHVFINSRLKRLPFELVVHKNVIQTNEQSETDHGQKED